MKSCWLILSLLMTFITMSFSQSDSTCKQCFSILRQAVHQADGFFIKVHAAEALIYHQDTTGLEELFLQLENATPANKVGALRVLARLQRQHPEQYQQDINALIGQVKNGATAQLKLTALESLGKLGYKDSFEVLQRYADTGTNGFKVMARWILSNQDTKSGEDALSELLSSNEIVNYRIAAYALRFKKSISQTSRQCLQTCLKRIDAMDAARVYVLSSLYVHSNKKEQPVFKEQLLAYLHSKEAGQRYEVAEALGWSGDKSNASQLRQLLMDDNTDVQVAAANALLKLVRCSK